MTAIVSILIGDPRFIAGVREFNDGNFFEAHELWEEVWNDLVGDPKQLCQGLIQIAAGYHKLAIGTASGARKLFERGLRTAAPFLPNEPPELRELVARVTRDLERLRGGAVEADGDPPRFG